MSQSIRGAVAQRAAEPSHSLVSYLDKLRPEIQAALPKGMDADRVARIALNVVRKTPKLAECTPVSFTGALLTASALGLEPGVNGEAYLVPYKTECTLIIGYQGYAKLFWQHPLAKHLECRAVYENDQFDYAYGLEPFLVHKPARNHTGQRITDYYAVATLSTGASAFVVLSPEEVKELRGGKSGPNGDIPDPMHWMERKTALRQLVKTLPKSTNLSYAMDLDEKQGSELSSRRIPEAIENRFDEQILDGEIVPERQPEPAAAASRQPPAAQPENEASADTRPVTPQQVSKLDEAFAEVGWNADEDKTRVASRIAGRAVAELKGLTRGEAKTVADLLADCAKSEDPQSALADTLEGLPAAVAGQTELGDA